MSLSFALVAVALGCGGDSGGTTAPTTDSGTTPSDAATTSDGVSSDTAASDAVDFAPGPPTVVLISAANGGTIASDDGRMTLEFPPGALSEDTEISIRTLTADEIPTELESLTRLGRVYDLQPSGLTLNTPALATHDLPTADVPPSPDGRQPVWLLATLSTDGVVEPLGENVSEPGDLADTVSIRGELAHFSYLYTFSTGLYMMLGEVAWEADLGQTVTVDVTIGWLPESIPADWLEAYAVITFVQLIDEEDRGVIEPLASGGYEPMLAVLPSGTMITPKPAFRCAEPFSVFWKVIVRVELDIQRPEGARTYPTVTNSLVRPISCRDVDAACCNAGSCSTRDWATCEDSGGEHMLGRTCDEAGLCDDFSQACCVQSDGRCQEMGSDECALSGGVLPDPPRLSCADANCPTSHELAGYWSLNQVNSVGECSGGLRPWAFWPTVADGSSGIITTRYWAWNSVTGYYSDGSERSFEKSLLSYLGTWQRGATGEDGLVTVQIDHCTRDYPHTPEGRLLANAAEYPCTPNELATPTPFLWDPVEPYLTGEWTTTVTSFSVTEQMCVESVTTSLVCSDVYAPLPSYEKCCTSMCSYWGVADAAGLLPAEGSPERTELIESIQCPCGGAYLKDTPPGD